MEAVDNYFLKFRHFKQTAYANEPHLLNFLNEMAMAFAWTVQNTRFEFVSSSNGCLMVFKYAHSDDGFFGFLHLSTNPQEREALWNEGIKKASFLGCKTIKGPIQGNTFFPYRIICETDGSSFFKGEYFSNLEEHKFILSQNPIEAIYYRSYYRTYFQGIMDVSKPYWDDGLEKGLHIKSYGTVDRELFFEIAGLIDRIFGGNWSFQQLSSSQLEAFYQSEFNQVARLALYTIYFKNELVGFCRFIENDSDTLICKTLGLLPEFQKMGLGNAIVYQMHADAISLNYSRMIYALIFEGNRVQQNMPRHDAIQLRTYQSYTFNIE